MAERLLRDRDLRSSLSEWLAGSHLSDSYRILHELKIPRPSARIDIAFVNGSLTSYEIKSDVDKLDRLPAQMLACGRVFDRSYIVITGRHIKSVLKRVPSDWGIILACDSSSGIFLSELRQPKINIGWCIRSSLHILTKKELRIVHHDCSRQTIDASIKRDRMIEIIIQSCEVFSVREKINLALKSRGS